MSKKQKKMLRRILTAAVLFVLVLIVSPSGWTAPLCYAVIFAVIGYDVLWKAIRNIARGQVFDENFLMAIATVGAFLIGKYSEAVEVMLFYQVGELFQSYAVGKSRQSISQLMDIRPDYANVESPDGQLSQVDPEEVAVGDTIVVKPGERLPLDGTVLEGASSLDTAALTGESLPREVAAGDDVISGCINQTGLLRVQVTKPFEESTVARILDLVENSGSKKAKAEHFITKFARYYTPAVVIGAVALAVLPPLVLGGGFLMWLERALTFLVISCPCALVISIPLSFFGGIGGASRRGILVKGGNYLEALAQVDTMVFDKTGTLTRGVFSVTEVHPEGMEQQELLELAALAEQYSNHPISRSLKAACQTRPDPARVAEVEELSGHGVLGTVDGKQVAVGNGKLMDRVGALRQDGTQAGTVIHVAVDGSYAGRIVIADQLKEDAKAAMEALRRCGVKRTVMLTGDNETVAAHVAQALELNEYHAGLLPADKVDRVEALLAQQGEGRKLAFVGDGINDAPVLARADVGIAMGALGSDAAIEAADVVLMDDAPSRIADAIAIARKTNRIVKQNIVFALGVKGLILLLGALGLAGMQAAVFADVGVAVVAILNSMRTLKC